MQLGQVADPSIGFYPHGEGRPEPESPVTLAADPPPPQLDPLLIDPATAAMLTQEFGPAVVADDFRPPPLSVELPPPEKVEPDPTMSLVAVGIGVALIGGALWYFSR